MFDQPDYSAVEHESCEDAVPSCPICGEETHVEATCPEMVCRGCGLRATDFATLDDNHRCADCVADAYWLSIFYGYSGSCVSCHEERAVPGFSRCIYCNAVTSASRQNADRVAAEVEAIDPARAALMRAHIAEVYGIDGEAA